ncbi:MAG: hypothetical protein H0T75_08200 [Rhizobiales bacterium]|nr:hypothetical protein [Hyphomicrobiales bacterium]
MTHRFNPQMKSCVDECLRCYAICLQMAMNHYLEVGGEHVKPSTSA